MLCAASVVTSVVTSSTAAVSATSLVLSASIAVGPSVVAVPSVGIASVVLSIASAGSIVTDLSSP